MDLLELGCSCLTIPWLKEFMDLSGYPGKGIFATLAGVAFWLYGNYRADRKAKQLAYAIVLSLTIVAALTLALKYGLQLPRPTPRSGFGFPSGDSATAFSLAAAAGAAYPAAAPALYFIAALSAISRLYFRAHFVWDVIGGASLGAFCGYWTARKFMPKEPRQPRSLLWLGAWLPATLLSIGTLLFFWLLEREIARHKINAEPSAVAERRIDFGTAPARAHLIAGWTENRIWPPEAIPYNWVDGLAASVALDIPEPRDLRMLIRAYPYRPRGFLCQRGAVRINGALLGEFFLEQDWQNYAVRVPRHLLRQGSNRFEFTFKYSDRSNWHGMNRERKPLSVAFQRLSLTAE